MAFDDGTYSSHSTPEMIRVARLATPVEDQNLWVLTSDWRTWSFYYHQWHAVGLDLGQIDLSEVDFRENLAEQLRHYNIGEAHPLWTEH